MEAPATIQQQRRRFHDGGVLAAGDQPEVPPTPGEPPRIVLERRLVGGRERFLMLRRIGYTDRDFGEILVPGTDRFTTDLASVPTLFTWLVPKTGAHLPAALLHDGLCAGDYVAEVRLTRVDADRVFRDAMADTGTTLVRRWLVWSAVATATMVHAKGTGWSRGRTWAYRLAAIGTLGLVALLGILATFDLFDVPGAPPLPWMDDGPFVTELAQGVTAAVLIPAGLGLLWGRFRIAGWVMLTGLAVLLHVTLMLVALTGLYRAVEWVVARLMRRRPG